MDMIDIHVHIGYWQLADLQGVGTTVEEYDRLRREWNIAGAAVTTTDGPEDCITRNRQLMNLVKDRPEYYYFPWIRIQEPRILDFVMDNREHVRGFKVHPAIDKVPFDDPAFEALSVAAGELGVPILVHCGAWKEMTSYEKVLPAAQRHPEVDYIMAHATGGSFVERTAGIRHLAELKLDNVYVDITGTFRWKTLQRIIEDIGPDKVLFGSDYALGHPHMYRALMEVLNLSPEDKENIFSGNSLRLLSRKRG